MINAIGSVNKCFAFIQNVRNSTMKFISNVHEKNTELVAKNEHFSWKAHLEIIWSISLTFCTVFAKLHALAPVFSNDGYIEFRVHQLNLYFSLETANSTVLLRNPNPNELVNWTKSSKLKFIAISSCWIFLFQVKILPIRFKLDWIINFFERTIMTHVKNSNFHRKKSFMGCSNVECENNTLMMFKSTISIVRYVIDLFGVYVSMAPDCSFFVVWFWALYNQF